MILWSASSCEHSRSFVCQAWGVLPCNIGWWNWFPEGGNLSCQGCQENESSQVIWWAETSRCEYLQEEARSHQDGMLIKLTSRTHLRAYLDTQMGLTATLAHRPILDSVLRLGFRFVGGVLMPKLFPYDTLTRVCSLIYSLNRHKNVMLSHLTLTLFDYYRLCMDSCRILISWTPTARRPSRALYVWEVRQSKLQLSFSGLAMLSSLQVLHDTWIMQESLLIIIFSS